MKKGIVTGIVLIVSVFVFTFLFQSTDLKYLGKTEEQASCEKAGNVWRKVGKAQIPACVVVYSDGGKECTSSNDCEGNCVKLDMDAPAFCQRTNSRFGCQSSVEDIAKGEGILCID